MSVHPIPITTRREQLHLCQPQSVPAPVHVHPAVSWDVRHAEQLEQLTGRRIDINECGEPMLVERSRLGERLKRALLRTPAPIATESVNY